MDDSSSSSSSSGSGNSQLASDEMTGKKRDAEAVGLDDDSGITMVDVLENEKELDEDANAVLGGSDDQNCTYPSGYIKRQALYACGTCLEKSSGGGPTPAGICLACSYSCHEGHRLFELYTKRNFRCDCGNSKFNSNPCKLYPEKDAVNVDNNYNQNFDGVYCTCSRPYPDPDDEIEDEMIQCIICEDWYHGRHLGTPVPTNNEYGEMICGNCIDRCEFLMVYNTGHSTDGCEEEEAADEGVVTVDDNCASSATHHLDQPQHDQSSLTTKEETNFLCIPHCTFTNKDKSEASSEVKVRGCLWKELASKWVPVNRVKGMATFWPDGWRTKLCTCSHCKERYGEKNVLFLLDDDDTVHHYEEQGKAKNCPQSRYDQGMQALSQLDRIRQVEAICGYNDMKMELLDFLKDFAERKKVVRKEDIDEFFNQMRARKRRRLDVQIPQFCR